MAVKFLREQPGAGDRLDKLFQEEIRIQSAIRAPNIAPLLGHCEELRCLVYPLYEGGSLHVRLGLHLADAAYGSGVSAQSASPSAFCGGLLLQQSQREEAWPPLAFHHRLQIAHDVASALQHLHWLDTPIVHRDVKPSNVLLDASGRAVLSDTECARFLKHAATGPSGEDTLTGAATAVVMTSGYDAPEITGIPTRAHDVFSLGVVLLQLATALPAKVRRSRLLPLEHRCA